jgi:phosphate starvation-inducible membrane PsiE
MSDSYSIQKLCPFMMFLLGRIAVVANEVFISTWMLVSILEPQNPVYIVDRRVEFCVWIIDLCLEDECHCMWGEISFWRLYFQIQTMYVEFLTLQVNILVFWLISISKTAAMNTLIWTTPTDHDCFAVACQVWSQDLITMLSRPCTR